jgi:serine/threonine protein kinase/RNA polymerase subunit RPABC4/transcription elongation factor Spt4
MSETVTCGSCGHAFEKGHKFCPRCGTEAGTGANALDGPDAGTDPGHETVCGSCAAPMGRDDRFCPACGKGRSDTDATVISNVSLRNAQANHLADATTGEFEIEHQLGVGAMGSVYLATDIALSRKVAIKVIASSLLQDDSMVSRFRLEAQTVASLRHPNIVNVHAVRQAEDLHYFVMDFIDGPALRSIIKTHAPLEIPIVQALLYQVGSGLDYAHHRGKGVIHRDIKPANIMVDREGNAFVTDFGISKIAESQTGLTQTGATIGTPEYMSPEQCRGEELTGASDQYAVGIMAYEMICGKTPFSGSQYFVMVAHTSEEPKPILDVRPDCPAHVAESVHRMLAKNAEDRFPDLESAMAAMGGAPLSRRDPIREHITVLAGSTAEVRALDSSSLSPLPGRTTGGSSDTATSITVMGLPTSVEVGDLFTLSADVRGSTQGSLPGVSVSWSSTDSSVAIVTGGEVRALKAGTAVVSAAVGSVTNSISILVGEAAPVAILVDPASVEVASGQRQPLIARVQDKHGQDIERPIRWLTSDARVASVDREGTVVATGGGVATITAESDGVTGTSQVVVKAAVPRAPSAPAVSPAPARSPAPGAGARQGYRRPAAIGVGLLLVGTIGVFGARTAGLMGGGGDARGGGGEQPTGEPSSPSDGGSTSPTVVAAIDLAALVDSVRVGDSIPLEAVMRDAEGDPVTGRSLQWATDDESIGTVRGDWLVASASGSLTLSASIDDAVQQRTVRIVASRLDAPVVLPLTTTSPPSGSASNPGENRANTEPGGSQARNTDPPAESRPAPVRRPVPATLTLSAEATTMILGEIQRVTVDVRDADGNRMPSEARNVALLSADPSVVTVDQASRRLTAVGRGETEIVASLGGIGKSVSITVEVPVQDVLIEGGDREFEVGGGATLRATVTGPGGIALSDPVVWSSSAPSIVLVDGSGGLTAVGAGSASVTATVGTTSGQIAVTVSAPVLRPPTAAEVADEIARYLSLLNDGDEDSVRSLHGSDTDDELGDLLDIMSKSGFEAELTGDGVGDITLQAERAAATFDVKMSYRGSFGGGSDETRQFVATFSRSGGGWVLASVIMLPD